MLNLQNQNKVRLYSELNIFTSLPLETMPSLGHIVLSKVNQPYHELMQDVLLSLQSQQTKIHKATKYGVSTWCHFHVTTGRVVMVDAEALPVLSDAALLLDEL